MLIIIKEPGKRAEVIDYELDDAADVSYVSPLINEGEAEYDSFRIIAESDGRALLVGMKPNELCDFEPGYNFTYTCGEEKLYEIHGTAVFIRFKHGVPREYTSEALELTDLTDKDVADILFLLTDCVQADLRDQNIRIMERNEEKRAMIRRKLFIRELMKYNQRVLGWQE